MTTTINNELVIDNNAHNFAKVYASLLTDEFQRKRAYASLTALYALVEVIKKNDFLIDNTMTLSRIPKLNEEFEISDFYVNKWHVDVRVITDGDSFILPRKHFDNNVTPDFYAVIKIDKKLENATLLGFAQPKEIEKEPLDYHYYTAKVSNLISYENFIEKVKEIKTSKFSREDHNAFKDNYLSYTDGEMDIETKSAMLRHLFACKQCRMEFCCFTGFEMVSCNIGKYPEILDDDTLSIIGATVVDDEKYIGKEETISFEDDVLMEDLTEKDENNGLLEMTGAVAIGAMQANAEETVSDILSELFSPEEDFTSQQVEDKQVNIEPQFNQSAEISEETATVNSEEETASNANEDSQENYPNEETEQQEDFDQEEIIEDESEKETEDDFQENETRDDSQENETNESNQIGEDDIEIVEEEENTPENVQSDESTNNENIEIIDDNTNSEISYNETPNEEEQKENSDIEYIKDNNKENVQKVIVDYDKNGEPVYSYITNIPNESEEKPNSDFEPINDDILNVKFDPYSMNKSQQENDEKNNVEPNSIYDYQYNYTPNEQNNEEQKEEINQNQETNSENKETVAAAEEQQDEEENNQDYDYKKSEATATSEEEEKEDVKNIDIEPDTEITFNPIEEMENSCYPSDETPSSVSEDVIEEKEYFRQNMETEEEFAQIEDEINPSNFLSDDNYDTKGNISELPATKSGLFIIISLIIIGLAGFGIYKGISSFSKDKTTDNITSVTNDSEELPDINQLEENVQIDNSKSLTDMAKNNSNEDLPPLTEKDLLKPVNTPSDINKALANAFSGNTNTVSLKNINWLCTPQLFTDTTFKAYLQALDDILKVNIKKNLAKTTDLPKINAVSFKIVINKNGSLEQVKIADSCGSDEIDNVVLQSINESFDSQKAPVFNSSKLKDNKYYLKLIVKL